MKKIIFISTFLFIFSSSIAYSQTRVSSNSLKEFERHLVYLKGIKNDLVDSLSVINNKIDSLSFLVSNTRFKKNLKNNIVLELSSGSFLYKYSYTKQASLAYLKKGQKVIFLQIADNDLLKIKYKDKIGYVNKNKFKNKKVIDNIYYIYNEKEQRIKSYIDSIESNKHWVKSYRANFRTKPSTNSKIIAQLKKGDVVFVQEKKGNWFKVKYLPSKYQGSDFKSTKDINQIFKTGWIYSSLISKDHVAPLSFLERMQRKSRIKKASRRKTYVNNHPNIKSQFKEDILNGKIRIGMTKPMVKASWGVPSDINRTVTRNVTREQWVYGSIPNQTYVYFVNGKMTSFQD